MADQQLAPFRTAAARHRRSRAYIVPWVTGGRVSVRLDNIGYLNALRIRFNLSVVVGTSGTVTDADATSSNFAPFIGLRSPQGEYIWTTNSRDLTDFNYRLQPPSTPFAAPGYSGITPGTASTQPVNFSIDVPVALNESESFDFGMLMRQISNNNFYCDIQMAAISDLIGTGSVSITGISGQIEIAEIFYDAVADNSGVEPPNFGQYIRLRSLQFAPLISGQNDCRYDTGPIIVDAMYRIHSGAAADPNVLTNVAYIQMLANKGNEIDNRTGEQILWDQYFHLSTTLRAGVLHENYCDDTYTPNTTKARDFINSNLAAQIDAMVSYTPAPPANSYINQFFREIVTLAA